MASLSSSLSLAPASADAAPPRRGLEQMSIALLLAAYAALAAAVLPGLRFLFNPDAAGYISIARHYAAGDFHDAINGFWSPLYCWLLTVPIKCGIPPLTATKILGAAIGAAALLLVWALTANLRFPLWSHVGVCAALIIPILHWVGRWISPDLLATTVVLGYLAWITRVRFGERPVCDGAVAGVLGALAYLAKTYAFGFFFVHFLFVACTLFRANRRNALRVFLAGVAALAILSCLWGACLATKYGHFTLQTASEYAHRLNGPSKPDHVIVAAGLLEPPNPRATTSWEDPTFLTPLMQPWGVFNSLETFRFQLNMMAHNARDFGLILQGFSWLALPLLALALALSLTRQGRQRPLLIVIAAALTYPVGLMPFQVVSRYVLIEPFTLVLIGCAAANALPGQTRSWQVTRILLVLFLAASFIPSAVTPLRELQNQGRPVASFARRLSGQIPPMARTASDDAWLESFATAFEANLTYLGPRRPGSSVDEFRASLDEHAVEVLFVWDDPKSLPFLSEWTELATPKHPRMRIFRRPARPAPAPSTRPLTPIPLPRGKNYAP